MNKAKLKQMQGRAIRLHPLPFRSRGGDPMDDTWDVDSVSEGSLSLSNRRTGHRFRLYFDSVLEYREPDLLMLKVQLTLTDESVLQEPLRRPPAV